jgi:hypothetical protein
VEFGASTFFAKIADFVTPGSITATRMPNGATSCASPSLTPSSAHFDATYGDWAIAAIRPAIDVTFTMVPERRWRICGSTACTHRIAPQRSTFITSRYSCGGHSSATALPPTPALFTRWSTRPAVPRISAKPCRTDSSSAMSSSISSTVAPAASAIVRSLSARPMARTVPNTRCPASDSRMAVARPMPEFAPVTTETGAPEGPVVLDSGSAAVIRRA